MPRSADDSFDMRAEARQIADVIRRGRTVPGRRLDRLISARSSRAFNSDLFGIYTIDAPGSATPISISRRASDFLKAYEDIRSQDPILRQLMRGAPVMDGVSLLGVEGWQRHALARFLRHWGLNYSMQGAVIWKDRVCATLNVARSGKPGSFAAEDCRRLEALCRHVSLCLEEAPGADASLPAGASGIILSDRTGRTLSWGIEPTRLHPLLGLRDMQAAIGCAVAELVSGGATAVMRDIACGQSEAVRLVTVALAEPGLFLTFSPGTGSGSDMLFPSLPFSALPTRNQRVLDLLVRGYSNKMIAREMGISANTVKDHVRRLYAHFGVSSRAELGWILHGAKRA